MYRTKTQHHRNSRPPASLEYLEQRQLLSGHAVHLHKAVLHAATNSHPLLAASHHMAGAAVHSSLSAWPHPPFPTTPKLTATSTSWHAPLALTTTTTSDPLAPVIAKTVQLTIGDTTGKTDQPLGINIGSSTSYAQGNVVNNLLAQGGSFELANGRLIAQTATGSTTSSLVVTPAWLWQSMGYSTMVGQTLVGSTGANMHNSWTITGMHDQLDANGNPTGNTVISIAGTFASAPLANDSFFVQITGNTSSQLADSVNTAGNVTITRDNTTAYSGNSSALFSFGNGTSNTGTLKYYFGASDTGAGRNVLQPGHTYQLSFWAKTTTPNATADFAFYQGPSGSNNSVSLVADGQWHQYTLNVPAVGPVQYSNGIATIDLSGTNGTVNLDVVKVIDLTDQISPTNPLSASAVNLIKQYGFSNLRFWDQNLRYASLDDMIGPADGRPMVIGLGTNYSPILGLPEMLELSKETHTQMWLVIPTTWTPQDMHNLMEYLGGSTNTVYGANAPPTDIPAVGSTISHSSISKPAMNHGTAHSSPTPTPTSTPTSAALKKCSTTSKPTPSTPPTPPSSPSSPTAGSGTPGTTSKPSKKYPCRRHRRLRIHRRPQHTDEPHRPSSAGALSQQLTDDHWQYPTSTLGKPVMIYEEAPGELNGGLNAATESAYATSLAAGLATIRNAMVLERDYGISTQNLFTLFQYGDSTPEGYVPGHYGIFSDQMTASTNPRPVALAAKLLDQADGQILSSSLSDGWVVNGSSSQALATTTQAADALVTYDGTKIVITLFNNTVNDNQATTFNFNLPATIAGRAITANWAAASYTTLNGPSAASNNENTANVAIRNGTFLQNGQNATITLPAHSMSSLVIPLL